LHKRDIRALAAFDCCEDQNADSKTTVH